MKILVTGGAGFIGSHVVDQLINEGHTVTVIDDLSGGFVENVNEQAKLIIGDLVDTTLVDTAFKVGKFDIVYHLAAYAAEGLSHFIRKFNYENNLIASVNVINACVKYNVQKIVFTSSMAVYGHGIAPFYESDVPSPCDPYGVAKYAVELDLKAAFDLFGLRYTIIRPHNVYGERQNIGDKYRNVIGIFINKIMKGEPVTIYGDGEQIRAFSYITDVAPAIVKAGFDAAFDQQIVNVGGDIPFSINMMVHTLEKILGQDIAKEYLPPRNEVKVAYSEHVALRNLWPDRPDRVSLEDGLVKMFEWALINGAKESEKFGEYELIKNMPPFWQ